MSQPDYGPFDSIPTTSPQIGYSMQFYGTELDDSIHAGYTKIGACIVMSSDVHEVNVYTKEGKYYLDS